MKFQLDGPVAKISLIIGTSFKTIRYQWFINKETWTSELLLTNLQDKVIMINLNSQILSTPLV
jgi:hypothetical protein